MPRAQVNTAAKPKKEPRKKPKPRYLWLALGAVLVLPLISGCNKADMKRLDLVDKQIVELTEQEASLKQQVQLASLTAAERNATATSLERTTTLLAQLKAEREQLAGKIQEEGTNWVAVGTQVVFALLGLGGIAGRKPA